MVIKESPNANFEPPDHKSKGRHNLYAYMADSILRGWQNIIVLLSILMFSMRENHLLY